MTLILIEHPDVPDAEPGKSTPEAFEAIWKHKGWTIVEGSEEDTPTELVLPDGSLDRQIAMAQAAMDNGGLTPENPALSGTERLELEENASSAPAGSEGAPVPVAGSEAVEGTAEGTDDPSTPAATPTGKTGGRQKAGAQTEGS